MARESIETVNTMIEKKMLEDLERNGRVKNTSTSFSREQTPLDSHLASKRMSKESSAIPSPKLQSRLKMVPELLQGTPEF